MQGHAEAGLAQANAEIEALVRETKGKENFNEEQEEKYDSICAAIIEPESQRVGHCKAIISELSKSK